MKLLSLVSVALLVTASAPLTIPAFSESPAERMARINQMEADSLARARAKRDKCIRENPQNALQCQKAADVLMDAIIAAGRESRAQIEWQPAQPTPWQPAPGFSCRTWYSGQTSGYTTTCR